MSSRYFPLVYPAGTQNVETAFVEGCSGSRGGGRFVLLKLTASGETISEAAFECNGCPSSMKAVGGLVAFLRNRKIEQAARLEASDLLVLIGGLPDGKGYWAEMAVEALQNALSQLSPIKSLTTP